MARKKNNREIRFKLNDDDYKAFGHYRILYTAGGRKMINRQRITYIISGLAIAGLFYVFPVDKDFTMIAYVVAAIIGIGGAVFAEKLVLRQQDKALKDFGESAEAIHPEENVITLGDTKLITDAGSDHQEFDYKEIKLVDLTEEAIYVWMSDIMIMPVPLHAFSGMDEMKETYKLIRQLVKDNGGSLGDE